MFTDRSVLCPSCNKLCTGAKSGTKGDASVGMTSTPGTCAAKSSFARLFGAVRVFSKAARQEWMVGSRNKSLAEWNDKGILYSKTR